MLQDLREKIRFILFSPILSVPIGLFLCDLYLGITKSPNLLDGLTEFDPLGFWYETPFYLGYLSDAFLTCLAIIGVAMILVAAAMAIVLFKTKHQGTAHWARFGDMVRLGYLRRYQDVSGPIFGKSTGPRWFGRYLTNGEQPHSLVVAPTRAGKGVGVVIPTLLTFNGSVVALDVKGELFELTSRARLARGDRIFKFSPLDREGRTHCYNPVLDIVAVPPERRFAETRRLATNLITAKGKGAEGFLDGARDLFVAGVLACIERGTPTIGAVYDLFAQPGEKYKLFAQLAEESQIPEVQRIFDNMAGNDTKIITSYTSVLGDGGLNLWADPLIKNATSRSDFDIYELRRDPTSIYLCVSPNDLEVVAPLVRLFFQQLVSILQRSMPDKEEVFEVLFLLDEFKHLGKLESIETAVTTIAGYKGRFMFIIQSLSALTGAYEEAGKENFLSNTGIQVFMATADDETPQYISKAIGDYTYTAKSTSYQQREWFNSNVQMSEQGTALLRPEQVRLISEDMQIVLIKGQPPLHIHKTKYYSDRNLKKIFEAQDGPLPQPDPIPMTAQTVSFAPVAQQQEQAPPQPATAPGAQSGAFDPDLWDEQEASGYQGVPNQHGAPAMAARAAANEAELAARAKVQAQAAWDVENEARLAAARRSQQLAQEAEQAAARRAAQLAQEAQRQAAQYGYQEARNTAEEQLQQSAALAAQKQLLDRIIELQKLRTSDNLQVG